jgi:hypothetical protein
MTGWIGWEMLNVDAVESTRIFVDYQRLCLLGTRMVKETGFYGAHGYVSAAVLRDGFDADFKTLDCAAIHADAIADIAMMNCAAPHCIRSGRVTP